MSTGETWRLGHRPALDGLRGIAVLLVVACHAGLYNLSGAGSAGVTIFFTLSGFLITALLLQERDRTGRVNVRAFYARRARRLLPGLFFMLTVVGGTMAALGNDWMWLVRETAPVVLYIGNWWRVQGDYLGEWSHTWSLAVEEQFYLLWPLVFVFLRTRRAFLIAAGVSVTYAVTARFLLFDGGAGFDRIYQGTDTRLDGLMVGCALAAWMHGRRERTVRPAAGVTIALLVGAVSWCNWGLFGAGVVVPTVIPFLTAALIYTVAQGNGARWLEWRPLALVGRRSYGLYLWHYPILGLGLELVHGLVAVAALVALSWLVTLASWRYVEAPFMRMRHRVERPAVTQGRPLVVARG